MARAAQAFVGRLDGRAALVTGGSGGIGRAAVFELPKDGADVAVQYNRGREAAESAVRAVKELGRKAVAVRADVSSPSDCRRLAGNTLNALARLVIGARGPLPDEENCRADLS